MYKKKKTFILAFITLLLHNRNNAIEKQAVLLDRIIYNGSPSSPLAYLTGTWAYPYGFLLSNKFNDE